MGKPPANNKLKIGLLSFSRSDRETEHIDAIQELINYAQSADELGFSRFWLGEHYLYQKIQHWTNPDMLVPILLASTNQIKVGVAGTLISIHHPLDTATNYKLLANLFPDRVDLGLAKGGTGELKLTDGGHSSDEIFVNNVRSLTGYLREEEHHFARGLVVPPILGKLPERWLLGSSYKNIDFALEIEAGFSRSLFHLNNSPDPDIQKLEDFKDRFLQKYERKVHVNLAIAGCCTQDMNQARKIVDFNLNSKTVALHPDNIIAGPPALFRDKLEKIRVDFGIDEFILLQLYENQNDRLKGIELIAREFDL